MKNTLFIPLILVLLSFSGYAQEQFRGELHPGSFPALEQYFYSASVYQFDAGALAEAAREAGQLDFQLQLGSQHDWPVSIVANDMRTDDYKLRAMTENGVVEYPRSYVRTFKGYMENGENSVRLTLDNHFLYGYIEEGDVRWFVEPLRTFVKGQSPDLFVVYRERDVVPYEGNFCAASEMIGRDPVPHNQQQDRSANNCWEVELAIASDYLMFVEYNMDIAQVEAQTEGVMNNVQGNYDDEFGDNILFNIVEQFVSICSTCDPWTNSTNATQLLMSFRNWAPNGFSAEHDLGSLWTDRELDGSTIGIAYLTAVCTNFGYHVLQDFSTNASFLRVLTAHEIGHNFSCTHDPPNSNTIMAPAVNNTNTWSSQSFNQVNSYLPSIVEPAGCLATCPSLNPPVPDFKALLTNLCPGSSVQFINLSTGNSNSVIWDFPGGNPTVSSDLNPVVTYNNPGVYSVTLTLFTNQGTFQESKPGYIMVGDDGQEVLFFDNFEAGIAQWSVSNPDNSNSWSDAAVGGAPLGSTAAVMTNFDYNAIGQLDGLVSPIIDLTGRATAKLSFEHAYVGRPGNLYDKLRVRVSTDGGNTFPFTLFTAQENGGGTFATALPLSDPFVPADLDDWCYGGGFGSVCYEVDLSQFGGEPFVVIMFENECGFGNNLYIDNVVVSGGCYIPAPFADFTAQPTSGCAPLLVSYIDLSTGNPTFWNWTFPGGIPETSTDQNPVVVYNDRGVFDAYLTAGNVGGTDDFSILSFITVDDVPIADFSATIDGSTVYFDNFSEFADIYDWDFGDGGTSSEENPVYTYSDGGTYTVKLTASNSCGTDIAELIIDIQAAPSAGFFADTLSGCAPLTVTFADTSTGDVEQRSWIFTGGTPGTSSDEMPVVTYDSAGYFPVTLIVSNFQGADTLTIDSFIQVLEPPVASFSDSIVLDTAFFTNTSMWADSVEWNFGDGNSSTETDPTHVYEEDGTYTVTLIISNICGSDTTTGTIVIATPPEAGFGVDTVSGCEPLTVVFSDSSTSNTDSLQWFFPGGDPSSSTDTMPEVTYTQAGIYGVTLIAINNQGADTLTIDSFITVNPLVEADFESQVSDLQVEFTNLSVNADSTMYRWFFGDGDSSQQISPVHTYAADGFYTVTLIASNDCGSDTISNTIAVGSLPTAAFTLSPETGCLPLQVQYTNASSLNTTSWSWNFPGGNPQSSTEENPLVTYSISGTWGATLIASNGLGSDTFILQGAVVIEDVPTADFDYSSANLDFSFTDNSTNATGWSWDFGDGQSSTDENPDYTYGAPGIYTVTLIATNACGADTTAQTVEATSLPVAGFNADQTTGCAPFTVQFQNTSSGNTDSLLWQFEGGNPSTSNQENPTVTWDEPGVYSVSLIAFNAQGSDTLIQEDFIAVVVPPVAVFTATIVELEVTFTNSSTGNDDVLWDFGDGNTSTEDSPVHEYDADGVYTVTLIISNICGADTFSQTLTVGAPPTAGFSADQTGGCIPMTVQFQSGASENTVSVEWSFPGGSPATSADENPVVTYSDPGLYSVTMIATNALGSDTLTLTDYITVGAPPQSGFTGIQTGPDYSFTNTSTDAMEYLWDFGDGNESTEESPSHLYDNGGTYTVTLIATNSCGSDTTSLEIDVVAPPVASFKANNTNGCSPLVVEFQNLSTGEGNGYFWEFEGGDPSTSTEINPVVTYNQGGQYTVKLTVTNIAGESVATEINYVTVLPDPTAGFSALGDLETVTFTNTSTNATDFLWDFGDGNGSTESNPVHLYADFGSYEVTLTAWNSCDTVSVTQTVVVSTLPSAAFTFTPQNGCLPLTVLFTDGSSSNTTGWQWSFEGPETLGSTEQNPEVTFQVAGTYSVTLIASNATGADTLVISDAITILGLPMANFAFSSNDLIFSFSNLSSSGDAYAWDFGDGAASDEENPVHTYAEPGFYDVRLVTTNGCGSDTAQITVTAPENGAAPIAAFEPTDSVVCVPATISFTDLSTNAPTSWAWSFPGGEPASSTEQNPVVTYSTPGSWSATLIASNAFGHDTITIPVAVTASEPPSSSFDYSVTADTVQFTSNAVGASTLLWVFGDGAISIEPDPTHVYGVSGEFTVFLIAGNSCGTDTSSQVVNVVVTSTETLPGQEWLRVFPNPNSGFFTLDVKAAPSPELNIKLFDIPGRQLLNKEVDFRAGSAVETFTVSDLPAGTYILQLQTGNKMVQRKIIVSE